MKLVLCAIAARVRLSPCRGCRRRPPRDTDAADDVPTGLRVVSVTEDTVTLAWNASTDNSGSIHALRGLARARITRGTARSRRSRGWCPNYTQTYRVYAIDAPATSRALSRAADARPRRAT